MYKSVEKLGNYKNNGFVSSWPTYCKPPPACSERYEFYISQKYYDDTFMCHWLLNDFQENEKCISQSDNKYEMFVKCQKIFVRGRKTFLLFRIVC